MIFLITFVQDKILSNICDLNDPKDAWALL